MDKARIWIVVGTLCVASASTGHAQRPLLRNGLRAELVGCYALFTAPAGDAQRSLYNASASVRLDSQAVDPRGSRSSSTALRLLTPLTAPNAPMVASPRQFTRTWTADSLTDTVRLSFVDGFSGAVFVFAAPRTNPDTLFGRRSEHWDFGPPFETTHGLARAIRQPCA